MEIKLLFHGDNTKRGCLVWHLHISHVDRFSAVRTRAGYCSRLSFVWVASQFGGRVFWIRSNNQQTEGPKKSASKRVLPTIQIDKLTQIDPRDKSPQGRPVCPSRQACRRGIRFTLLVFVGWSRENVRQNLCRQYDFRGSNAFEPNLLSFFAWRTKITSPAADRQIDRPISWLRQCFRGRWV